MTHRIEPGVFPVGSRVRLNAAGRDVSRTPRRRGTLVSLGFRYATTCIVRWDGRRTNEAVNIIYLERADD
jgi:hypothetical protein